MKNFFSEKNLRKTGLKVRPFKKFKKKIKSFSSLKKFSGALKIIRGDIGFKALDACVFTSKQIDSVRRSLLPIRKILDVCLKIKVVRHLTRKAPNSRMGKGKGKYVCTIGTILRNEIFLELSVVDFWKNGSFIYSAISKLPIRIQLVFKRQNPHESYILEPFDSI